MRELQKLLNVLDEMEDELFELEQFLHRDVREAISMWEGKVWSIRNFAEHEDTLTTKERMTLRLTADQIYRRAWERRIERAPELGDVYLNFM